MITAVSSEAKPTFKAKDRGIGLANDDVSHTWMIFALDKRNGRVIWTEKAYEGVPRAKRHVKATQANSTPVIDGRYVAARCMHFAPAQSATSHSSRVKTRTPFSRGAPAKAVLTHQRRSANGKLYLSSEDGDVFVVKAGREYELLSRNTMSQPLMATPALSDGMLIIRENTLYAFGEHKTTKN